MLFWIWIVSWCFEQLKSKRLVGQGIGGRDSVFTGFCFFIIFLGENVGESVTISLHPFTLVITNSDRAFSNALGSTIVSNAMCVIKVNSAALGKR